MYKVNNTYPSDALYTMSNILDLRQIYIKKILIQQHKDRSELTEISHTHNTRHKQQKKTKTNKAGKAFSQRSYWFLAPHIYRQIPTEIKNLIFIKHLKKKIIEWLQSQPRMCFHRLMEF